MIGWARAQQRRLDGFILKLEAQDRKHASAVEDDVLLLQQEMHELEASLFAVENPATATAAAEAAPHHRLAGGLSGDKAAQTTTAQRHRLASATGATPSRGSLDQSPPQCSQHQHQHQHQQHQHQRRQHQQRQHQHQHQQDRVRDEVSAGAVRADDRMVAHAPAPAPADGASAHAVSEEPKTVRLHMRSPKELTAATPADELPPPDNSHSSSCKITSESCGTEAVEHRPATGRTSCSLLKTLSAVVVAVALAALMSALALNAVGVRRPGQLVESFAAELRGQRGVQQEPDRAGAGSPTPASQPASAAAAPLSTSTATSLGSDTTGMQPPPSRASHVCQDTNAHTVRADLDLALSQPPTDSNFAVVEHLVTALEEASDQTEQAVRK